MTDIDPKIVERLAFSDRLNLALKQAGFSASITKFQRAFNAITRGNSVTIHATRKWMVGESIPTQDKLKEIAGLLNCNPNWLRYGDGSTDEEWCAAQPARQFSELEILLVHALRRLPEYQQLAVSQMVDSLSKGNTA